MRWGQSEAGHSGDAEWQPWVSETLKEHPPTPIDLQGLWGATPNLLVCLVSPGARENDMDHRDPRDAPGPTLGWEPVCRDCDILAPRCPTREEASAWAAQHRQASGHTLELTYVCDDTGDGRAATESAGHAAPSRARSADDQSVWITYTVTEPGSPSRAFPVRLHQTTLRLLADPDLPLPPWTRVAYRPCPGCLLPAAPEARCPAAVALAPIVAAFHDTWSCEAVEVTVATPERQVTKRTGVHEALSGLVGLTLMTSGCPRLAPLRPLALGHLPFSDLEEMFARIASLYAFAQLRRHQRGLAADWTFAGLAALTADVAAVLQGLLDRLEEVSHKDAVRNALLHLHCYVQYGSPAALPDRLAHLDPLFSAYWTTRDV